MKIAAEVFGVEQAMDFDTMETSQYCVLGVLGETVRVPISEAQMEALTKAATQFRGLPTEETETGAGDTFDETKEEMTGPPLEHRQMEERPFSIVAGLEGDTLSSSQELAPDMQADSVESDPGLGGLFEESEENKEAKLRAKSKDRRQPVQTRTVPRDSAGNPQVPQNPAANLPRIATPGMVDDDFPQG